MKKLLVFALFTLMVVSTVNVFAYSVTVNFEDGILQNTSALTGTATTGGQMGGMLVTAYYLSGGSETVTWAATADNAGEADGTDWVLSQYADTFSMPWTLTSSSNLAIESIFIDAGAGNTVFDTTYLGDIFGTDGSARGFTFAALSGTSADLEIIATYSGAVGLDGADPVGDIYRYLDISFINDGAFDAGSVLKFKADADNLLYAGDIDPSDPVPEPATIILLGAGLLGLAARRRKA